MVEVYAVIGESESRKSALIRCLTGVYGLSENWGVAWRQVLGGNLNPQTAVSSVPVDASGKKYTTLHTTYVQLRAPQEAGISEQAVLSNVAKSGDKFLVIALRNRGANGCPDADTYLQHFMQNGWNVHPYVQLGTIHPKAPKISAATCAVHIPSSRMTPANSIADSVRTVWPIV